MSDVKLTDYLPDSADISAETLADVRTRLSTYITNQFGDAIDTSPNSVFGDLILGPLSHLIAAFEMAAGRIFSDIDLANVAAGTVYNCDFVQRYLENFGLSQRNSTNTTGVVRVTFSEPGTYIFDAGTVFSFTDANGEHFFEMADVTDQLTIKTNLESGQETSSLKQLNRLSDIEYVVNIPVLGNAGVSVSKNATAKSNLSFSEISSITAVTDFDPGVLPENVMELAHKSRDTYYAASLSSRNGALSFLLQTYPELQGVSPTVSGDLEMLRGKNNAFGIKQGVMDIFIKSKKNLITTTVNQRLAYNSNTDRWIGVLEKPQGPAMHLRSFNISNSSESYESFEIFSKASDLSKYPGISHTYSSNEALGIVLYAPQEPSNTTPASIEHTTTIPADLGILNITGNYEGALFKDANPRNIGITFNSYDKTSNNDIVVTLSDSIDSLTFNLTRDPNDDGADGVVLYTLVSNNAYNKFLKGINITFSISTPAGKSLDSQLALLIDSDIKNEQFTVTPKYTNFIAEYDYDPLINSIEEVTAGNDVKPINCDIQVRGFIPCIVNNITIVYRSKSGSVVDLENARTDIFNYVNGLSYPNLYETYSIAEILMYRGADGVKDVSQSGAFYPSVANFIVTKTESFNHDNLESDAAIKMRNEFGYEFAPVVLDPDDPTKPAANPIGTTTLIPSEKQPGMGERNIQYILAAENIIFDEVSF